MWRNVIAQRVAVLQKDEIAFALVSCFDADFQSRVAWVEVVPMLPPGNEVHDERQLFADIWMLVLDHLFSAWQFRKLYLRSLDLCPAGLNDLNISDIEATMPEAIRIDGSYHPVHIHAIPFDSWKRSGNVANWSSTS